VWPQFRNMPLRDEYLLPVACEALENSRMTLQVRFREYSEATRGLMSRCLEWDPDVRCTTRGALQHAYFKEEPRGCLVFAAINYDSARSCFVANFSGGTESE
jgi:hypothetical protein